MEGVLSHPTLGEMWKITELLDRGASSKPAEIRNGYLRNTSLGRYRHTNSILGLFL